MHACARPRYCMRASTPPAALGSLRVGSDERRAMLWITAAPLLPLLVASEQPEMLLGQPLWSRDGVAAQYVFLRKQFELHATPTGPVPVDITAQPSWSSQGDAGNLPKLLGAYKLAINGVQIAVGPGRSRDGELGVDRIADVRPVQ